MERDSIGNRLFVNGRIQYMGKLGGYKNHNLTRNQGKR